MDKIQAERKSRVRERQLGKVHVYTGNGKGKSTAAIGQGIRAVGAGWKVLMLSFLKNPGYSELKALQRLAPDFRTVVANSQPRRFYWELSETEKGEVARDYQQAWEQLQQILVQRGCDLLILDEIMAVINYGIIPVESLLAFMQLCCQHEIELVLTGRDAPPAVIENADLVTEMTFVKHPMYAGAAPRLGIEY